jgi:hypothetical protein
MFYFETMESLKGEYEMLAQAIDELNHQYDRSLDELGCMYYLLESRINFVLACVAALNNGHIIRSLVN